MADPKVKEDVPAAEGEEDDEEEIEEINTEQTQGQGDSTVVQIAGLMQNPEVLAALQGRLSGMIGTPSGYIQSLPAVVKRRLKALKKLQFDIIKVESTFYEKVHELECAYAKTYDPLLERRRAVVTGEVEPTDSDCDWPSEEEDEDDEELAAGDKGKADKEKEMTKAKLEEVDETKPTGDAAADADKSTDKKTGEADENPSGVPEFWLTIFKNIDMLSDMIQEHDEPILRKLRDIQVKFTEGTSMGFTLLFTFAENDFFTDAQLTKQYFMKVEPDADDPFSYEGPEIVKCTGCTIHWKKGQNVTVKTIKKVQKHRGRGTKRTVTKTVQNDSFFNFFTPPTVEEGEEADDEMETLLGADFEIGHFIRDRVIPRAVLYFTGEALDDDDEYDDELSEGDESEVIINHMDNDGDDEDDPDFVPPEKQPGECKQQ